MAILPRSAEDLEQLHDWMKKIAALLDHERVPAREVVDVHSNMLILALIARRFENEPAALETIDILIAKLQAMRQMPDAKTMQRYLTLTSVRAE